MDSVTKKCKLLKNQLCHIYLSIYKAIINLYYFNDTKSLNYKWLFGWLYIYFYEKHTHSEPYWMLILSKLLVMQLSDLIIINLM